MMDHKIRDKIIEKAISLKKYGVNDLAWSREDALNLIELIMEDKIGVLGGDVYKITADRLVPLYDNWSCEFDDEKDGFLRSKIESQKYIENYPVKPEEKIVFSITFTE